MTCHEIQELLPLHLYGDLTDEQRGAVEAHLAGCPACREELAALGTVRRGLDRTAALPAANLAGVYRRESERQQRRSRRWRLAAALAGVAALVALAARVEVRADGRQVLVRWGAPEAPPPAAAAAPAVVVRPEPVVPPGLDERLATMSALIQALAADIQGMDRDRRQELVKLQQELASFRQHSNRRLSQTERDVSALYTAQYGPRPTGANP